MIYHCSVSSSRLNVYSIVRYLVLMFKTKKSMFVRIIKWICYLYNMYNNFAFDPFLHNAFLIRDWFLSTCAYGIIVWIYLSKLWFVRQKTVSEVHVLFQNHEWKTLFKCLERFLLFQIVVSDDNTLHEKSYPLWHKTLVLDF